jgi:CheY-like chemotaxis protein/HPt (histidine-containing phosphotransfer) domain-containing protein
VTKGVEGCSKAVEIDNLRGKRVLVAEDNKINQQVAREALEESGVIVEIADNGEVAVEMIRESRFDAVLMDVQMPGIDGYEASRRIRSDRRFDSLPIIAMTAHSLSGDREKCLEAGMNDHLPKPVDFDELHAMLETWLVRDTEFSGPQARPGIAEELPDQLDGFDLPPAIKRMRGDRGLLRKLLIEFHRDYVDVAERIRRDLANDDRASAGHLAHDVAGVSGNLGANDLREAALALERGVEKALSGPELLDQFEKALDIALTATAGLRPRS